MFWRTLYVEIYCKELQSKDKCAVIKTSHSDRNFVTVNTGAGKVKADGKLWSLFESFPGNGLVLDPATRHTSRSNSDRLKTEE